VYQVYGSTLNCKETKGLRAHPKTKISTSFLRAKCIVFRSCEKGNSVAKENMFFVWFVDYDFDSLVHEIVGILGFFIIKGVFPLI
jgi:hypothetical protein